MKLNIAVVFGGRSVEHEISVLSALQSIAAIDQTKYNTIPIYISKDGQWYTGANLLNLENYRDLAQLTRQAKKIILAQNAGDFTIYQAHSGLFGKKILGKIDVVFPITHGTNGEDGVLQGLLTGMNIPYVGCEVLAAAISMDKIATKLFMQSIGVPVLDYFWFYAEKWIENREAILSSIKQQFTYPVIVKPANSGSSVGVSSVGNDAELEDAVDLAVSLSQRILVEPKVIDLREINCAVLGDRSAVMVSVCEEPLRADKILSYQDKYLGGTKSKAGISGTKGMSGAKRQIPANIPESLQQTIQDYAKQAFVAVNCSGVARIDFLLDQKSQKIYLCELNTIPGSLSFYLWEPLGIGFTALITRLIELALKRHRENNNLHISYATNILQSCGSSAGKL